MSKYHVEVSFDLSTSIEPDGVYFNAPDEAENVDENLAFDSGYVTVSGGSISFDIEADDEDDAESKARYNGYDEGSTVDDSNGFTWEVENVNIEVELVEEPMTLQRAIAILKLMLARWENGGGEAVSDEEREALTFLRQHLDNIIA